MCFTTKMLLFFIEKETERLLCCHKQVTNVSACYTEMKLDRHRIAAANAYLSVWDSFVIAASMSQGFISLSCSLRVEG